MRSQLFAARALAALINMTKRQLYPYSLRWDPRESEDKLAADFEGIGSGQMHPCVLQMFQDKQAQRVTKEP